MSTLVSWLRTLFTFKCARWGFGCLENIDAGQWSLTSFITCLDFKLILSIFNQSLHFVSLRRPMVNDREPGGGKRDEEVNIYFSNAGTNVIF